MFCSRCGAQAPQGAIVCPACGGSMTNAGGAAVVATPAQVLVQAPAQNRVEGHVRLVAVFWMVIGGLFMIPVIVLFVIGTVAGVAVSQAPDAPTGSWIIGSGLFYLIAAMILIVASLQITTGWGLYRLRPWARTLALIMGVVSLISFPFGTALGIYTLWVLIPQTSEQEYRALVARGS
jgi:hypothetical protein